MPHLTLINELLSLNFLCLDDGKDDREYYNTDARCEEFFHYTMEREHVLLFVSLRTKEQVEAYRLTKNWNDFHLAAHYIQVDNIVSWLLGSKKMNIRACIDKTLLCATNKKLVENLYSHIDKAC